jgi:hypothetical protein
MIVMCRRYDSTALPDIPNIRTLGSGSRRAVPVGALWVATRPIRHPIAIALIQLCQVTTTSDTLPLGPPLEGHLGPYRLPTRALTPTETVGRTASSKPRRRGDGPVPAGDRHHLASPSLRAGDPAVSTRWNRWLHGGKDHAGQPWKPIGSRSMGQGGQQRVAQADLGPGWPPGRRPVGPRLAKEGCRSSPRRCQVAV